MEQFHERMRAPHQCPYCGERYHRRLLFTHFQECPRFIETRSDWIYTFSDMFEDAKKEDSPDHLILIKDVLANFTDHIDRQLRHRNLLPSFDQPAPPKIRKKPPRRLVPEEEVQELKEEVKKGVGFLRDQEPAHECVICKGVSRLCTLGCGDQFCYTCLLRGAQHHIVTKKQGTAPMSCDQCSQLIVHQEIEALLGKEAYSELMSKYEKIVLTGQFEVIQCPGCKDVMSFEEAAKVDYNIQDEEGKKVSPQAAQHFAQFRVRCPSCKANFCKKKSCNAMPYHLGKTCQEYQIFKEARHCRFCEDQIPAKMPRDPNPAFQNVCQKQSCFQLKLESCTKMLPCGHPCSGFMNEKQCLPCIIPTCPYYKPQKVSGASDTQFCKICGYDVLHAKPCVLLDCNHCFHLSCIIKKLNASYQGPRITFSFAQCPQCRAMIRANYCEVITKKMDYILKLYEQVRTKALQRLKIEGLEQDKALLNPQDQFFQKPQAYALRKLSFFLCNKCHNPYFGGLRDCRQDDDPDRVFKKEELICGKCTNIYAPGNSNCLKHGREYIEYKCKFCCSVASWFCWGSTHFCDECHIKQNKGIYVTKKKADELPQCEGKEDCPLKIVHPKNGDSEYAIGCILCR